MTLQLRARHRTLTKPPLTHLFSTTTSSDPSDPKDPKDPTDPNPQSHSSSLTSYFSDVKASLKQQQQQPQQQRRPISQNPSFSNHPLSRTSGAASLEEIRKNLSEFRRRSAVPEPTDSNSAPSQQSSTAQGSTQQVSFQELYNRNVLGKSEDPNADKGGKLSFNAIRESLKKIKSNTNVQSDRKSVDPMSLSAFTNSLKLKPNVIGGTDTLPMSIFGKEKIKGRNEEEGSYAMKTDFVKLYDHAELGEKLRRLRPEAKGDSWFSLKELNERLMKLREMEEMETQAAMSGVSFRDLRDSLVKLKISDEEKVKKTSIQRLDILGQFGRTPSFMLQPPKEHLVEKYFHPDNMSSAEKLKIELAKVREEFKMSESDCGSARVQVAQLTTKIKHLSSVLHKKDKHSRKGLQAMLQRRKRLLKYLRKTDWDSYCFVLSKLGLRDKPEFLSKLGLRYKTDNKT
ncbi:hypothetical protein PRUPE_3G095300 [Prunus persica]|uniref:Small ribosomal subunit protein uS15c n=1 Tax=Prunus persica TaxID=3760 RepID=M5WYW8_PRUPE|nr:uncharacterized protein LOC18783985 [Prunus persica]ONI16385.1 hypothetical protein PRUPE_3G095300 [Prunus persica]